MPARPKPAAEFAIDEALVRALLADQHPDLVGLSIAFASAGWDNEIYRLGTQRSVRLPRREVAAPLIRHEQQWLPQLAERLPLAVPVPDRVGAPALGYPWHWSVCRWLPGETAAVALPAHLDEAATTLGGFLAALHVPAPSDAPPNPVRGVAPRERAEAFEENLAAAGEAVDAPGLRGLWEAGVAAPLHSGPELWLHGDLHPANLLVQDGRLSAAIDFGDLCSGDRASDLAVAWMLFGPGPRERFRRAAGAALPIDDATWLRARAWAVHFGVMFAVNSGDSPTMHAVGKRTLAALRSESV